MVTDRDTRITRLERLYGLVDIETVTQAEFKDCEPNAAVKVLSRLVKRGSISRYPLFGRRKYYRSGMPLGPQALSTAFALLRFCVLTSRPKVSRHALGENYPFLSTSSLNYATDGSGLRALRVDLGGDADALVRKLRDQHQALYPHDQYRQLITESLFSASILTYSEDKAREVQRHIKASPSPYAITAVVIPDLLQLL